MLTNDCSNNLSLCAWWPCSSLSPHRKQREVQACTFKRQPFSNLTERLCEPMAGEQWSGKTRHEYNMSNKAARTDVQKHRCWKELFMMSVLEKKSLSWHEKNKNIKKKYKNKKSCASCVYCTWKEKKNVYTFSFTITYNRHKTDVWWELELRFGKPIITRQDFQGYAVMPWFVKDTLKKSEQNNSHLNVKAQRKTWTQ